jgi:CRP-like cAMP-binding protein
VFPDLSEGGAMQEREGQGLVGNRLLDALAPAERDEILAESPLVALERSDVLAPVGERSDKVYFPVDGVISIMTLADDGVWVESATIGNEGMLGIAVFLGGETWGNAEAIVQVPGSAYGMPPERFRTALESKGKVHELVSGYTQALFAQVSQSVVCNGRHSIEQRAARWLLQTSDRMRSERFALTQEYLAVMLGVRRPSVSVAAKALQDAGVITYSRGSITILDRPGLERVSCGCYNAVRAEYERLVPL